MIEHQQLLVQDTDQFSGSKLMPPCDVEGIWPLGQVLQAWLGKMKHLDLRQGAFEGQIHQASLQPVQLRKHEVNLIFSMQGGDRWLDWLTLLSASFEGAMSSLSFVICQGHAPNDFG